MAIGVDIFFVDDEPVEAVGNILEPVYLQMSGIFGSVGFARREETKEPNP